MNVQAASSSCKLNRNPRLPSEVSIAIRDIIGKQSELMIEFVDCIIIKLQRLSYQDMQF